MTPILAKVFRGETLESIHRGHIVAFDGEGNTILSVGEPETVTFWRSASKIFQAIPFITSGAADAFGFNEREIALACASHSGESFHTETAAEMLAKIGLDESDLRCGTHPPFDSKTANELIRSGEKPDQLHNNCSGKHAAMLAFAKHIGADPETYLSLDNPVQQEILRTTSIFSGVSANQIKLGIDGCSAPNFAVPISAMAKAFSRLNFLGDFRDEIGRISEDEGSKFEKACRRIIAAQIKYPEYIGGSVRLDTKIMQALPGKLICKVGAEGVWCATVLPSEMWKTGLGIALKVEDGDDGRARPAVAIELLRRLGIMDESAEATLSEFSPLILKNRKDIVVGKVAADF
ncbi:MAG: asparaginase [Acidobacteria bacterium]|nr:asparaginase [Acidobacteriota bacterium]